MIELIIKYLIIIVLVFCHEMGHILMCIIFFKCEDWKIDMGLGKVLFETKRLIIRPIIVVGKILPQLDWEYYNSKSKLQKIMIPLGGPLFNLIVLIVTIPLLISEGKMIAGYSHLFQESIKFLLRFNMAQLFWTLLPIYYKRDVPSDGRRIIEIIKDWFVFYFT